MNTKKKFKCRNIIKNRFCFSKDDCINTIKQQHDFDCFSNCLFCYGFEIVTKITLSINDILYFRSTCCFVLLLGPVASFLLLVDHMRKHHKHMYQRFLGGEFGFRNVSAAQGK